MLDISEAFWRAKRYSEAVGSTSLNLEGLPGNVRLEAEMVKLQLSAGNQAEARAMLTKLQSQKLDQNTENTLAYALADASFEPAIAREIGVKAVADLEEQAAQTSLDTLSVEDLRRVVSLGAVWDTMGWVYSRNSDFARVERYLLAAWNLRQDATTSDHLGQVYEKEGKMTEAIHAYRLALAVKNDLPETQERLAKLEELTPAAPSKGRGAAAGSQSAPNAAELSRARSVPVPGISRATGSAEVFLLLSPTGVKGTRFIEGDERLKDVLAVLSKMAVFDSAFPDAGPEQIARRGVLSCTQYTTPNCTLVLLLATDARP